jgi:predicted acylesterase/phospholipase RssA
MRFLQKVWHALREPFVFLKPIRFVVIPLIALLLALIFSDEGQDSIRAVVEFDPRCPHWGAVLRFILWVTVLALQSWYWSRQLLRVNFPQCAPAVQAADESPRRAKSTEELAAAYSGTQRWMPRLLGISAFLVAIGALLRAAYLDYSGGWDYTMKVIAVTIGLLTVVLVLFVVFVVQRRKRIGLSPRVTSQSALAPATRYILRTTLVVALLFDIWTAVSPLTAGVIFPSPSMLMVSAALWIGIGSWLVYWADLYRVPIFATLFLFAIGFSFINDNHSVRKLSVDDGGGNVAARKDIGATFEQWLTNLNTKYRAEARHPVYIVATEGGGIRAAYWTASVLTALQDQAPQFADHTFAISGVSGGSVGATVFASLVADGNRASAVSDCDTLNTADKQKTIRFAAQQILSSDFLAPTLASLLHADLVQRFLPIGFIPDRAKALETGWQRGWRTHVRTASGAQDDFFSGSFMKMYGDRPTALIPSLFLNGTIVERGNRIIGSNCIISSDIPESADIFNELGSDMRLSTAAHNSARFTYVSPAGSIRNPGLIEHVVDGGYFENSGAQTAADLLRTLRKLHPEVSFNLVLIRYQEVEKNGSPVPLPSAARFMNEVMSPLRALLNTRGARGTLAYAEAQGMVPPANQFEFLLTQQKGGIVLPLGWLLARRTCNAIDLQIGTDVPANLSPAIKPFVVRNVNFVKAITAQLAPPGGLPAPAHDSVQQEAIQSEAKVKE